LLNRRAETDLQVDWFFPNYSSHGFYSNLTIKNSNYQSVENFFLETCKKQKNKYSHIVTHFVELCTPFFYNIKKLSDAKIIVIDHNPRPLNGYPLKKKVGKKIKGVLFSRYIDLFVGVSNYTAREILKDFGNHLKEKTVTIYNGVLINDIKVRDNRNGIKPSFLVASHLRESKGIQDLIDAVTGLPDSIKREIKIDIYGEGPYKEFLSKKMNANHVANNFRFMGSQPNLNELFFQYDYLLQPTHMECFSLSILESLAANVPVITTNVGGNEEVVSDGKNGFIYPAKSIDALRELIKTIFLGENKIIINTRELINRDFSLEKMVDNYLGLIT